MVEAGVGVGPGAAAGRGRRGVNTVAAGLAGGGLVERIAAARYGTVKRRYARRAGEALAALAGLTGDAVIGDLAWALLDAARRRPKRGAPARG
jgi:hypothetical protein